MRPAWLSGQWTDSAQDFWNDLSEGRRIGPVVDQHMKARGSELGQYLDFSYVRRQQEGRLDRRHRADPSPARPPPSSFS